MEIVCGELTLETHEEAMLKCLVEELAKGQELMEKSFKVNFTKEDDMEEINLLIYDHARFLAGLEYYASFLDEFLKKYSFETWQNKVAKKMESA